MTLLAGFNFTTQHLTNSQFGTSLYPEFCFIIPILYSWAENAYKIAILHSLKFLKSTCLFFVCHSLIGIRFAFLITSKLG
ncbi:hypothetical protein AQUCO_05200033v1 [Aquilegia coerulea]|uniref:Uncharacterized protein n=1 Tax=Aquilegia coerulea TaxID=218851 RepID=A0A2G5CIR1_AQUCA|nr:hypothetical protein AQUCO_05200033v1 [Aquilegia coerulea]